MSGITIVWSMVASACLTVAALHLYIGVRRRSRADLLFAASAVCTAVVAFLEMEAMLSASPERQGELIRLFHLPFALLMLSLVLFVRSYLHAGHPWLGGLVVAIRLVMLVVDEFVRPNVNFQSIDRVVAVPLPWGEPMHIAHGVLRGWTRLGQLGSLIFVVFVLDAIRTAWKRGQRRQAAVVGGSVAFAVGVGAAHTALLMEGTVRSPTLISVAYLAVVAAMSWELTSEALRSGELSRRLGVSEAALDESERRMALAAEAADVGVWVHDVERDEIWVNERIRDLRGYDGERRLRFEEFLASIHQEDRGAIRGAIAAAIREHGRFECEYRVRAPDGGLRWISARGRAEERPGGGVVLRGASLDVTRRKEAELEAVRRRDELAHLSRVALLGELSGSLAHELKQPLTAILSNAQAAQRFLAEGGEGRLDEVRQILADIASEDKRAGEVIRRLRLLFQKGETQVQPIDLAELAAEALALARSELVLHGVAARTELPSSLPRAIGDPIQIQQVILNLVANACEAMDSAGAADRRIVLRASRADDAGLELSVSDSGGGLPDGAAERVFDPFFTTKADGVGLGLSVCRTIVDAHGGRLWATRNPDRGATFHFTLPAAGGAT